MSYMTAIRHAHFLRGLEAPALADSIVKVALKGLKNQEALNETPRAVMTLKLLTKARDKLKSLRMSAERKRRSLCRIWLLDSYNPDGESSELEIT